MALPTGLITHRIKNNFSKTSTTFRLIIIGGCITFATCFNEHLTVISSCIIISDLLIDLLQGVHYLMNLPTPYMKRDILKQIFNKLMHILSEAYNIAKALLWGCVQYISF